MGTLLTKENIDKISSLLTNANSLLTADFVKETVGLINDVAPVSSACPVGKFLRARTDGGSACVGYLADYHDADSGCLGRISLAGRGIVGGEGSGYHASDRGVGTGRMDRETSHQEATCKQWAWTGRSDVDEYGGRPGVADAELVRVKAPAHRVSNAAHTTNQRVMASGGVLACNDVRG